MGVDDYRGTFVAKFAVDFTLKWYGCLFLMNTGKANTSKGLNAKKAALVSI
jgi:RNA polymerase subunit RPABC4/transcription elongation factor Spt4